MKEKIVALVPMRGNSERVPQKNIKIFNGKPLYHHILNTLESTDDIAHIYVDTDCSQIAQEVKQHSCKITVIMRPNNLNGGKTSIEKIIENDIKQIPDADIFFQTHTTNPLLTEKSISNAISTFQNYNKADSLFSITEHYKKFFNKNLDPINHNPNKLIRTQDLEPLIEQNGAIYIFTRDSFLLNKKRIGLKPITFKLDPYESLSIDTSEDFYVAETLHRHMGQWKKT